MVAKILSTSSFRNINGSVSHARISHRGGEMIVLAGFMLAVTLIAVAVISSTLSGLTVRVSMERASSPLLEMFNLKDKFGLALNASLAGDIDHLNNAFEAVEDTFHIVEAKHGYFFDADLVDCWFEGELSNGNYLYAVDVNLKLDDGTTSIEKEMIYYVEVVPD